MKDSFTIQMGVVALIAILLSANLFGKRTRRSLIAMAYLAIVGAILAEIIRQPFWSTFLVLLGGVILMGGLILWWLTIWALRTEGRWGQFSLSSMIFFTVFAAIFFSAVRWLTNLIFDNAPGGGGASNVLNVAVGVLVVGVLSLPSILAVNDGLLWIAVWLIRRPSIRRLLVRRRHRYVSSKESLNRSRGRR